MPITSGRSLTQNNVAERTVLCSAYNNALVHYCTLALYATPWPCLLYVLAWVRKSRCQLVSFVCKCSVARQGHLSLTDYPRHYSNLICSTSANLNLVTEQNGLICEISLLQVHACQISLIRFLHPNFWLKCIFSRLMTTFH